jgi:hypothetical protein
MVKHHIFTLLTASLLSLPLYAAAPLLGPEVPLVPGLELRAAAYGQASPAAASNGIDHLVVWGDGRRLSWDIYGTRVRTDGQPVEPLGRRIATGADPRLASTGGDYMMVWQTMSGMQSMRLDPDGAPMSAPHDLGSGYPVALVSNGSTYLLITRPFSGSPDSATILDRDGVPLRSVTETFTKTAGAASYGGTYYLVDSFGNFLALCSIAQDGTVTRRLLPANPLSTSQVSAAFAPGAVLLASNSGYHMVVGYDGHVIRQPALLPIPDLMVAIVKTGWDGSEFLATLALSGQAGLVTTAFRLAADGTPVGTPFMLSKTVATEVTFASSEAGELVVWSETRDRTPTVVARAAPSFSTLTSEPTPATVLTYSGEVQGDVQIARGPRGILTVWGDSDRRLKVLASFNGGPSVTLQSAQGADYVGWPAVMAGEHVFLVVWRHTAVWPDPGPDRLLAKRFDFDGKDLDPVPLVILSQEPATFAELQERAPHAPSIAFDGSSFLVAWIDKNDLFTIPVDEAGPALNAEFTRVGPLFDAHSPRALWTGTDYVVSYTVDFPCLLGSPPCIQSQNLFVPKFTRTGRLLSELFPSPVFNLIGDVHIATARALGRVTFAFAGYPHIMVAQATQDGQPLIAPRVAVPRNFTDRPQNAEIVWNGSEYVVVWRELTPGVNSFSYKLLGIRLDVDLRPIDSAPFEVSSGPGPGHPASLITTPSGVLIAYSRADDANGGAPRAFVRTLARQPVTRNRAVAR